MTEPGWKLVVAGPARRSIERIPERVAVAVLEFLLGALVANPHRVGKPLRGNLSGLHSARVGVYRVVCEIVEEEREVHVLYIDHRSDVYRPH